jgi:hypothetical protein
VQPLQVHQHGQGDVRVAHRQVRREHNRPSPRSRIDAWSPALSRCTEIADCVTICFNAFPRFDYNVTALKSRTRVLKQDLPHFRCKLTPPKAHKQLKRLGMQRFFQEVARRIIQDSPGAGRLDEAGCRIATLASRLLIKPAPKVRKNRFECSVTNVQRCYDTAQYGHLHTDIEGKAKCRAVLSQETRPICCN